MYHFLLLCILLIGFNSSYCQQQESTRILFILDGSLSMQNRWEQKTRMTIAKSILSNIMDSLKNKKHLQMALRVYGHQSSASYMDCKDSRLVVGFQNNNAGLIKERLKKIVPKGTTPIAYSLQQAANDFSYTAHVRNIIILITDGLESCDEDPCAVSLELQQKNVILKPFIIGIGIAKESQSAFDCMGTFYNVTTSQGFKSILIATLDKIFNKTTSQVNLLDNNKRPSETDINMTFYDSFSGLIRYNYYHTLNYRGHPDTLTIEPVNTYDITAHTIPSVEKKNVTLVPNQHNIINITTPQGYLDLKLQTVTIHKNIDNKIKCIIRKPGDYKTIHVQNFNTTEKYLTGEYQLEILTLPRIVQNVIIGQDITTAIGIPAPGLLTILKNYHGYGSIFQVEDNKLKKIYRLNETARSETIALQPGYYRLIYRSKNSRNIHTSVYKEFELKSGSSMSIKL